MIQKHDDIARWIITDQLDSGEAGRVIATVEVDADKNISTNMSAIPISPHLALEVAGAIADAEAFGKVDEVDDSDEVSED